MHFSFFLSSDSQFQEPNPSISSLGVLFQIPRIAPNPIRTEEAIVTVLKKIMAVIVFSPTACRQLAQFLAAIVFFHGTEYFLAIGIHGKPRVSSSSLLISKQYILAMVCSLLEYLVEIVLFPGLKEYWWISNIGLAMVIIGEIIRKTAILTARSAFTHNIKIYHEDHHELVTHGIYRFVRHPGYCAFFIWAPGSQMMLCNPICTVAFTLVTWRFFATRIPYPFLALGLHDVYKTCFNFKIRYEEYFLRQFFGSEYEEYSRRVPSGVPFVNW